MGDANAAAMLKQADGANDIGELVIELAIDRLSHAGQSSEMHDGIECVVGQQSFTDVAQVEPHTWRKLIFRGRTIEGCDPMSRFMEVAHHMGTDEARGAGDENRKRGHVKLALSIRLDSHISSRFRNSLACSANFSGFDLLKRERFSTFQRIAGIS